MNSTHFSYHIYDDALSVWTTGGPYNNLEDAIKEGLVALKNNKVRISLAMAVRKHDITEYDVTKEVINNDPYYHCPDAKYDESLEKYLFDEQDNNLPFDYVNSGTYYEHYKDNVPLPPPCFKYDELNKKYPEHGNFGFYSTYECALNNAIAYNRHSESTKCLIRRHDFCEVYAEYEF